MPLYSNGCFAKIEGVFLFDRPKLEPIMNQLKVDYNLDNYYPVKGVYLIITGASSSGVTNGVYKQAG